MNYIDAYVNMFEAKLKTDTDNRNANEPTKVEV